MPWLKRETSLSSRFLMSRGRLSVGGDVEPARRGPALEDDVADGVHEVGLAEPDAAVDEQWVVDVPGVLGHRETGGVSQLVRRPDDEVLEREARVEPRLERREHGPSRRAPPRGG